MPKNNTPRALETLEALADDVRQMSDAAACGEKTDGIDWHVVARITAYADDETGDALLDVEYFRHADEYEKWKAEKDIELRAAASGLNLERFGDGDGSAGPIVVYRHAEQPVRVLHAECGDLEVLWGDDTARQTDDAEIVDRTRHLFAQHGFTVSDEAIRHNLDAWRADRSSGFRDEKNGVHLFSPCGCNPLRFLVSRLSEEGRGYQNTYPV